MALVESIKKGGRYTIKEQEERRIQVYHLHIEEDRTAVKIAELLGVNRNTINSDIRYWHSQLAHEFNAENITAKMRKQIQRIDMQRDRLLEYLDTAESDEIYRIAKLISEIDNKLLQHYSKMILSGKTTLEPSIKLEEIDENQIKELVRELIFSGGLKNLYSENELKSHFIHTTKCDVAHAENLLERMKLDGLSLCEQHENMNYLRSIASDYSTTFNLEKFANIRGYVTADELGEIVFKRIKLEAEIEKEQKDFEEKFIQKYGPDSSKWSPEIIEKFELGHLE